MASPQVNTKIERAVEAIESLSVAVAAQVRAKNTTSFQNVVDARQELRDALAEFVAPILRVVQSDQP